MNQQQIIKIFENKMDLNQVFLLLSIQKGETLDTSIKKVEGIVNLMTRKGWVDNKCKITEEGSRMLKEVDIQECGSVNIKHVKQSELVSGAEIDFNQWVVQLHIKLQDKLVELTGKKQKMLRIGKSSYGFLPRDIDLNDKLQKAIVRYKLTDLDKIEKLLLRHCKNESPLIIYYIMKDNVSPLAADYDNFEEIEETDDKITVKDTKNLF